MFFSPICSPNNRVSTPPAAGPHSMLPPAFLHVPSMPKTPPYACMIRGSLPSPLVARALRDFIRSETFGDLAAHHMQAIAEAFGHNQAGFCSSPGNERVIADRAGVKEQPS